MNLTCTNPNYIELRYKNRFTTPKVTLISRLQYLENINTNKYTSYKVRCNKCLACQIYKGYQWSNRLLAEQQEWSYSYFITLTFNDINYSKVDLLHPMREFQLFMKRLRKKFSKQGCDFKYYATGELGSETLRFHYHIILFSSEHIFTDMYFFKQQGDSVLYISPLLNTIWNNGNTAIAWAESNSMRYTANYVQTNNNTISHSMSQGIGRSYIQKNDNDYQGIYVIQGKFSKVPKQFKNINYKKITLEESNQLKMQELLIHGYDNSKKLNDSEDILQKSLYRK